MKLKDQDADFLTGRLGSKWTAKLRLRLLCMFLKKGADPKETDSTSPSLNLSDYMSGTPEPFPGETL